MTPGALPAASNRDHLTLPIGTYRPTLAVVDLGALSHNLRQIRQRIGTCGILAVVKAEAYGHGAVAVAQRLVAEAGANGDSLLLGVALVEEGIALRKAGIEAPILLLGGMGPVMKPSSEFRVPSSELRSVNPQPAIRNPEPGARDSAEAILEHRLTPVIHDPGQVAPLSDAVRRGRRRTLSVHVKLDTGMGRIGVSQEAALPLLKAVREATGLVLEGVLTHFADADLADPGFAREQLRRFQTVIALAEAEGIRVPVRHMANSAAIVNLPDAHFNLVRPGIMLYGYSPFSPQADVPARKEGANGHSPLLDLKPVLAWKTAVHQLKRVPPGTSISYGRTFVTRRESLIATLPVGYADGYSRALSNRGHVLVRGFRAPVVGRVCMDLTMVDVTPINGGVNEGDEVVLLGRQGDSAITAQDLAHLLGTIPYEVLCGISSRVPRVYVE